MTYRASPLGPLPVAVPAYRGFIRVLQVAPRHGRVMAASKKIPAQIPSTTWEWKRVKVSASRREGRQNVPKAPRWGRLARRNPKDALTLRITYRGGAECWYLVEARGSHGVFPGHAALHDVMRKINNIHD